MSKYNPKNERIKRDYFRYQIEADRKSVATVDGIRKSILRFEEYTRCKDFATFNREQAIAFKKHLAEQKAEQSDKPLSCATQLTTLNNLKAFLRWLAWQQGYKSKIHVPDIQYLNFSEGETRTAKAASFKEFPTLEQIRKVIFSMPTATDIEKRNRALIALTILTGMRDSAIASLRLKHIDLTRNLVKQDPREVKTKFSKRIDTFFFPTGGNIEQVVTEWVNFLMKEKHFGYDAPVFPKTSVAHDANLSFQAAGLEPECWSTAEPIRKIFRESFESAGIRYYNPHSFRHTLAHLGETLCKTPEEWKAWSQNLGHENPLTTFVSYGTLSTHRQGEVIRNMSGQSDASDKMDEILGLLRQQHNLTR